MERFDVVTGGAGFIGSHLTRALVAAGSRVKIVDNLSSGSRANLEGVEGVELVEGDVRNLTLLAEAFRGAEIVYHQAALTSVHGSLRDPVSTNQNNLDGTLNVLWAAKEARVRRVILASSSAVYGDSEESPKQETMPLCPISPYAVSKASGELYCQMFSKTLYLETICLRYFNVFGPRQDPTSEYAAVIPAFISRLLRGESPTIYGDGGQTRDFVYVRNVVDANLLAASSSAVGGSFNIGFGSSYSLNELAEKLQEILGVRLPPRYEAERSGDIRHSCADISQAAEYLGYRPRISFQNGLARTVEWFSDGYQEK